MVPILAQLNGLEPAPVPFRADFDIDAEQLVATGAQIIYVCAPNNPTGTPVSRSALEYVVRNAPGIVVLDEAYAEFAVRTHADLLATSERLLVVRTLSKAFGLAGLRIGYGIGAAPFVREVERARGPYVVNALAALAAAAALVDDADGLQWVRTQAALARSIRGRLTDALTELAMSPLPSDANFVFVPTAEAEVIASTLDTAGIRVRVLTKLPMTTAALAQSGGAGLRIGVGPWPSMAALLDVLAPACRTAVRA
jgi:histidinol-phosphate aminotransferase